MKNLLLPLLACLLFFAVMYSCTKTVTKTNTVTVTDTITKTIIDSNINLNNGLLAYYPFNGNVNDTSGNNMNGAIHGGVTFSSDIAGNSNSAVTFDGSSGYIIVPDPTGKFQSDAVSVSLLVKLVDINPVQVFVVDVNFNDGSGQSYEVGISVPNLQKFQFGVVTNTTNCAIPVYDPNAAITAGNTIVANQWYHVVGIFSNGLEQIFVNGVLNTAVTRSFSATNKCLANSLTIGGFWMNGLQPVNGSMDEVRIYNRALNQNEINTLARPVQ